MGGWKRMEEGEGGRVEVTCSFCLHVHMYESSKVCISRHHPPCIQTTQKSEPPPKHLKTNLIRVSQSYIKTVLYFTAQLVVEKMIIWMTYYRCLKMTRSYIYRYNGRKRHMQVTIKSMYPCHTFTQRGCP